MHLNSVIVEGTVVTKPRSTEDETFTAFVLSVERTDNSGEPGSTEIRIETHGTLASKCAQIDPGQQVRVVGRLAQDREGDHMLVAEHIEVKPIKEVVV